MGFVVAVDGPAGSGKGTITKKIAKEMNLTSIDTGAMYRSVTLAMLNENIASELDLIRKEECDKNLIVIAFYPTGGFGDYIISSKLLDEIKIEFKKIDGVQKVYLNGKDVSLEIRTKPVNENVSPVSTIKIVRERLAKLQREMAETIDVIMEGRDIGTNVFPNANVKIYLDATPEERARRRYLQNKENGIEMPYEEILESVKNRDFIDSTREIAPLKKADDAIYVDSSNMTIDEVVERIKKIISEKRK